jgi:hypothetical protein
MNNYINLFKTDFFSGVFAIAKKTWLTITYAYSIYYFAALLIGGIFAAIALLGAVDADFFNDILSDPNPEHTLMLLQQIGDVILTPQFIVSFIIIFIVLVVMASWNYYFAFITTNSEIKNEKYIFSQLLKLSISNEVLKLTGITLVLNIAVSLIFVVAVLGISMNIFLGLILFIAAFVLTMRFALVIPAFIIGNYDFNSAFAFSFHHINWSRAFKFFGISILAMLILMGVSLIIGLFSTLLSLIPFIGPLINIGVNVLLGAIMMSIIVAGLTGLYYRYAEIGTAEEIESASDDQLD